MSRFRNLAISAALLGQLAAFAQTERGTIRGTVFDGTGALIAGASVTVRDKATQLTTVTQSESAGNYTVPNVKAGFYVVTVEMPGFKQLVRDNVKVDVAGVTGLDLQLAIGEQSEKVTITSEGPQLKTESSEFNTAVEPKAYIDLPLNASGGRAASAFILLTPGVTGTPGFGGARVNGGVRFSREIQVDGLSMTTAEVGGDERQMSYSPESIQEFSIATTGYSAEFGNTGGGVERYTVRSGTDRFHGNAYDFLRNDKLDARGFFNRVRSINRQNEFGASIGGPVNIPHVYRGKDKTFFFFNANLFRFRGGPDNSLGTVPTSAFKAGDLSALRDTQGALIQLYDPASTMPDGAGGFTRSPFTGNIIPSSRISPVTRKILAFFPEPTLPGITNNYQSSFKNQVSKEFYTARVDHIFTDKHRLNASYNYGKTSDNGSGGGYILPLPLERVRAGLKNPLNHNGRLSHDWTFSPTTLNHFSGGITRQEQLAQSPGQEANWGAKLGIANVPNGAFPTITFDPYTQVAALQGLLVTVNNSYLFADSLTMVRGRHTLKFGADYRRLQNNFRTGSYTGSYSFSRNETALPTSAGRSTTGYAYASMLLGQVDSGNIVVSDVARGMRFPYFATYLQDDFKVSRTLTLNLGLRWDLFVPFHEVNNVYSIVDTTVPNPAAGGRLGALVFAGSGQGRTGNDRLVTKTAYGNVGPRLGLAWTFRKGMVLRTNYGISYYPTGGLGGANAKPNALGFEARPNYSSLDLGLNPAFNWDNGFPTNWDRPPFINPGFGLNTSVSAWGPRAHLPSYSQEWNFGIQRELGGGMVLDTSYVGNKATRLAFAANPNQVETRYLALRDLLVRPIADPLVRAAGYSAPYPGFTGTLAQALRPFPQYQTVSLGSSALDGFSSYHSLQVKLEKRFSKGLFLLTSYVWSKNLSNVDSSLGGGIAVRDEYNRGIEKALTTYSIPHRFVSALNYELPFGRNKPFLGKLSGVAGKLAEGWQINGILNYQSGEPIVVSVANTLPIFNSRNLPNIVPGVSPESSRNNFDPGKSLALNASAFSTPAAFTFGDAAPVLPNARNFKNYNENVGIMKRTYFRETTNLEFRFEMFNAFNRVRFGTPLGNLSDPFNFGKVTSQANTPRQAQFALKLNF